MLSWLNLGHNAAPCSAFQVFVRYERITVSKGRLLVHIEDVILARDLVKWLDLLFIIVTFCNI